MAHEIETYGDQAAAVFARVPAWHALGTVLDDAFTAEQAMTQGHLGGWNVRKSPMFEAETGQSVPNMYAVLRDNPFEKDRVDVLGTVGERYTVVQNEEQAELLNTLVDESGAIFDSAGSLRGGRQTFITMKLPGHMKIGGVDQVDMNVAAVSSHDGSMSLTLMVTPVRIVCANTLNAAFENHSNIIRVRHTSGIRKNLVSDARQALDLTFSYLDDFNIAAEKMINETLTLSEFEQIIMREFGAGIDTAPPHVAARLENKISTMTELFADSFTHEGVRETRWAGFNALVEYADHFAETRGDDPLERRAYASVMDPTFKNRALALFS